MRSDYQVLNEKLSMPKEEHEKQQCKDWDEQKNQSL